MCRVEFEQANIDKIEEEKPDKWLVSIKTEDVLEAEKIHLELKEQGYNVTLKITE